MLGELDALERSVGPKEPPKWRPYASNWEGEKFSVGERLEHFTKFN